MPRLLPLFSSKVYKHAPATTPSTITPTPSTPPAPPATTLPPADLVAVADGPSANNEVAIVPIAVYAGLVAVGNTSPLSQTISPLPSQQRKDSPLRRSEREITRHAWDRHWADSGGTREGGDDCCSGVWAGGGGGDSAGGGAGGGDGV